MSETFLRINDDDTISNIELTDYQACLRDYTEGDDTVKVQELEFSSDGEMRKIIAWHFGDGSSGFDIFDDEENLTSSFLIDSESRKEFAEFVYKQLC